MKINEVEKITGLTLKAIRLYEAKGLISVSREENGYRNYSMRDVEALKTVKLLRGVGVSIADIKLYMFGVVNIREIIDKRRSEIVKESGINSEQYRICEMIAEGNCSIEPTSAEEFTENEEVQPKERGALAVGIDIGTTTVSAVVYDIDNKEQTEVYTVPHNSYVLSGIRSEQSVSVIMEKAEKLLYHILDCCKNVVSIGVSGQMHGIVYTDSKGEPVSNLINWQDKRADLPMKSGLSACEEIEKISGEWTAAGYGLATHYYNMQNGEIPKDAVGFCSIMDLFVMRICGLGKAAVHSSVAASFGLFDIKNSVFSEEKLALLGIDKAFLPSVTAESATVGECRGIPVSVALGDNQASFLGSVSDNTESLLVNIGTGSQVSMVSDYRPISGEVELRPFIDGKYLMCGSALCGGFANSMVESFFRSYAVSAGMQEKSQFELINKLAEEAYKNGEDGLSVDVSFFGKRSDPNRRGAITMIDRQNFTPRALVLGVLKGMCTELYELYGAFDGRKTRITASGGAVRKNETLKKLLADRFQMDVSVNTADEEAATGAALFSAYAAGKIPYNNGFSEYVGNM